MAKLRHEERTVDTRTGEVTTIHKTFSVKAKSTEEFYLTFLSGLNAICELTRPSDIKILSALCTMAEFNTGKIRLTATRRKTLVVRLKLSTQSFSNSINRLKESGLVTGERGEYEINPQHFWKGTTDERMRLMRDRKAEIIMNYECDEVRL